MTNPQNERHPFLDDLDTDAQLTSTILRRAVAGPDSIKRTVAAVGSLYKTQTPKFFGSVDGRSFLQYEAELKNGMLINGVAVIERSPDNRVTHVSVTFSPLESALSLAAGVGALLEGEFGKGVFL